MTDYYYLSYLLTGDNFILVFIMFVVRKIPFSTKRSLPYSIGRLRANQNSEIVLYWPHQWIRNISDVLKHFAEVFFIPLWHTENIDTTKIWEQFHIDLESYYFQVEFLIHLLNVFLVRKLISRKKQSNLQV